MPKAPVPARATLMGFMRFPLWIGWMVVVLVCGGRCAVVRRAHWVSGYAHVPLFGQSPNILLAFATPDTQRTRLRLG